MSYTSSRIIRRHAAPRLVLSLVLALALGCDAPSDPPGLVADGLEVIAIGKTYGPDAERTPIVQMRSNTGGNTSVRNNDEEHLEWKVQGYYQRNRDLGQVFTPPADFWLDAVVLRTGPADKAVLAGTPGTRVFIEFFAVEGTPRINDNGTPPGTDATHGFTTNHRADDFIDGVTYRPIAVRTGGVFPDIPITFDGTRAVNGDAGRFYFMRWKLTEPMKFEEGRLYAFMVGLQEAGAGAGFTLANDNRASMSAAPSLDDPGDLYRGGWSLRREGDGTIPPTMVPGEAPPAAEQLHGLLIRESMLPEDDARWDLPPTTDGYPDVDTYRDLTFAIEVFWNEPATSSE